jgi:hypothetical protein
LGIRLGWWASRSTQAVDSSSGKPGRIERGLLVAVLMGGPLLV